MNGKVKLMTRRCQLSFASMAVLLTLASCAIVPPTGTSVQQYVLRDALMSPLPDIETRAEKGNASAQYALSILYQYGLRGMPVSPDLASRLRASALTAKGAMPITQYIPGINGNPGRTAIINIPRYSVPGDLVAATDACVASLGATFPDPLAIIKCGGSDSYEQLKGLWTAAVRPR